MRENEGAPASGATTTMTQQPVGKQGGGATTSLLRRVLAPVLMVLAAVAMVAVHAPQNVALSPIDEWVYVDYLDKVPSQLFVTQGEETGEYAREALSCNGVRLALDPDPALCAEVEAGEEVDEAFPMDGITSADIYTPLYFGTTWFAAQPLTWVGVDLLDAATLVGAVWLSVGLVLLYRAMRLLSVRRWVAAGLGILLVATPAAFWSSTYLSTDAPSLAVGAALLLLLVRSLTGRSGRIAFVVVSVAGVLFKVQNISAVGLGSLALLLWACTVAITSARGQGRSAWSGVLAGVRSRNVLTAVAAVVLSVVGQGAWVVFRAAVSSGSSPDQGVSQEFTVKTAIQESLKFLPGAASDPTGVANSIALVVAATAVSWLSIAGVVGLMVSSPAGSPERVLSWSAFLMALLAGPLLAVGVMAVSGFYFALPVRYGIPLLPVFLLCAGVLLSRQRWTGPALAAISVVVLVASFFGS